MAKKKRLPSWQGLGKPTEDDWMISLGIRWIPKFRLGKRLGWEWSKQPPKNR